MCGGTTCSSLGGGLGRVDMLITEGVRRLVMNSKDPAYLALYGKYGDAFNSFVEDLFGPVQGGKK